MRSDVSWSGKPPMREGISAARLPELPKGRAIPAGLGRLGADRRRIAIGGISMGGFGALHLATRRRFCAVGGHSPALWLSGGETPPGAFDDAADFDATTPFGRRLLAREVWLDVGTGDPFRGA